VCGSDRVDRPVSGGSRPSPGRASTQSTPRRNRRNRAPPAPEGSRGEKPDFGDFVDCVDCVDRPDRGEGFPLSRPGTDAADTRTTSSRFFPASGLSVRTALVYDGELASSVVRRGWFDFLVPADTLLAP